MIAGSKIKRDLSVSIMEIGGTFHVCWGPTSKDVLTLLNEAEARAYAIELMTRLPFRTTAL